MLLPETLIIFGLAVSLILMFAWTPFAGIVLRSLARIMTL
jgi:V/A-type H+-transporting ATPase subunit K